MICWVFRTLCCFQCGIFPPFPKHQKVGTNLFQRAPSPKTSNFRPPASHRADSSHTRGERSAHWYRLNRLHVLFPTLTPPFLGKIERSRESFGDDCVASPNSIQCVIEICWISPTQQRQQGDRQWRPLYNVTFSEMAS